VEVFEVEIEDVGFGFGFGFGLVEKILICHQTFLSCIIKVK
jgi:hypothetical protein